MLRKFGEHDFLVSLVRDKDVTRGLDHGSRECTQRGHKGTIPQLLVAERSAFAARVAEDSLGVLVLDQTVVSFEHFEIRENPELHSLKDVQERNRRENTNEGRSFYKQIRVLDPWGCDEKHRTYRSRLLSAILAVTPACQSRIPRDLSFKGSAHARPGSFRHFRVVDLVVVVVVKTMVSKPGCCRSFSCQGWIKRSFLIKH